METLSYPKRWAIAGALILALFVGGKMVGKTPPPAYTSSQWSDSPPTDVIKALRKGSYGSCKYVQSLYISKGQYAVRCSIDLATWDAYTVDLNTGLVH